jgi:hypothetical protein
MKKLIILPAIALSTLVFNAANAQEHVQFRNQGHIGFRDHQIDNRMHHDYVQPRFENNFHEDRARRDEHFYQERRHDDFHNYRGRR